MEPQGVAQGSHNARGCLCAILLPHLTHVPSWPPQSLEDLAWIWAG